MPESSENSSTSSDFTYEIEEGDTVATIAALFGSTVQDILDANRLVATDIIRPGDTLVVPLQDVPEDVLEVAADEDLSRFPSRTTRNSRRAVLKRQRSTLNPVSPDLPIERHSHANKRSSFVG